MNPLPSRPGRSVSRWVLGLLLGLFLVSCSTESRYKWQSFFFDGVPVPGSETNRPPAPLDEDGRPLVVVQATTTNLLAAPTSTFVRHPPYENRECTACHESKFSVRMKGLQTDYCFDCHDNFLSGPAPVRHLPVENGDCTGCHQPHGSPYPRMLVRLPPVLCFECHEDFLAGAKVAHLPAESGECSSCHQPHLADQAGLLAKPVPILCFDCHEEFLKPAAFTHAPVESGECLLCHSPHGAEQAGLLVGPDPQVCLQCHEEPELAKISGHQQVQLNTSPCVQCHDPHRSGSRFLLKPTANPGTPGASPPVQDPAPAP